MKRLFLLALLIPAAACATGVSFQWDTNVEPVQGYKVYCSPTNVQPFQRYTTVTVTNATLNLPLDTSAQYCAATAYTSVSESAYSNVLTIPQNPKSPFNFRRK